MDILFGDLHDELENYIRITYIGISTCLLPVHGG